MKKRYLILGLTALLSLSNQLYAQEEIENAEQPKEVNQEITNNLDPEAILQNDLFDMSLEDLMNIEVNTGSLVGVSKGKSPTAVTTITAEDIAASTARSLTDLIEIYVPGAQWQHSSEGQLVGMRGVQADRNYKMLLLVNGVNMNQKAHVGALMELDNWDMNDIEKIDIIRGPGSVTYGPGAIMGVVNIITKNGEIPGTTVNINGVSKYNSKGISVSHGIKKEKFQVFIHNSVQSTEGLQMKTGTVNNEKQFGYYGQSGFEKSPAQHNFKDYENDPQIKSMINFKANHGFSGMVRYNQSGKTMGNNPMIQYQNGFGKDTLPTYGPYIDAKQLQYKAVSAYLEKDTKINEKFSVKPRISYVNQMYSRNNGGSNRLSLFDAKKKYTPLTPANQTALVRNSDHLDPLYKLQYFSEQVLSGNVVANYKGEKLQAALGGQVDYNKWGKPWGKGSEFMLIGEGNRRIISDTNTSLFNRFNNKTAKTLNLPNGWSTTTYSVFGEVNYDISSKFSVLGSARYDKDTYSDHLFSPRLALISEINSKNFVRLVGQISNRMNTAENNLFSHSKGEAPKTEKLKGFEILYTRLQGEKFMFNFNAFYNHIDVLAWKSNEVGTSILGSTNTAGFEAAVNYTSKKLSFGINHAYTNLISIKVQDPNYPVFAQSPSYYNLTIGAAKGDSVHLSGKGKNLLNWSNNTTKLIIDYKPVKNLTLHADFRIFWKYEGNQDYMRVYGEASQGFKDSTFKANVDKQHNFVKNEKIFGANWGLNLSATYKFKDALSLTIYAMNVGNDFTRHGNIQTFGLGNSARGISYSKEPITLGARIAYSF